MAHSFALQAKLTTLIPGKGEQVWRGFLWIDLNREQDQLEATYFW